MQLVFPDKWLNKDHSNIQGIFWMLLAGLFFSFMVALIKLLGSRIPRYEIVLVRGTGEGPRAVDVVVGAARISRRARSHEEEPPQHLHPHPLHQGTVLRLATVHT